jgi:site-specific DNA-methyltransferase (adenine-specific)
VPYYADDLVVLHLGDCIGVMAAMPDASVDAVVTDPPYGLAELSAAVVLKAIAAWMQGDRAHVPDGRGFMGREWDKFVPPPGVWDECFRVLKPGGHLLSFAGSRTIDLMTLSIRIAGFEIRDSLQWWYGSGFPKSLDVSKAIDKAAGAAREIVGPDRGRLIGGAGGASTNHGRGGIAYGVDAETAPATEDASRWEGWGTALKPAHEPVVVARKPLAGTVAGNVLEWGTGALNVDGCRVAHVSDADRAESEGKNRHADFASGPRENNILGDMSQHSRAEEGNYDGSAGRWPPNILLTHSAECNGSCAPDCPVGELNRQSGITRGSTGIKKRAGSVNGNGAWADESDGSTVARPRIDIEGGYPDMGGASRFFPSLDWDAEHDAPFMYCAKAPKSERPTAEGVSAHPTVKPLALMRWLVRLVTPPGGLVLDPFAGTGTTGQACALEGFRCVLAEKDPDSAELARVRLSKPVQQQMTLDIPA